MNRFRLTRRRREPEWDRRASLHRPPEDDGRPRPGRGCLREGLWFAGVVCVGLLVVAAVVALVGGN